MKDVQTGPALAQWQIDLALAARTKSPVLQSIRTQYRDLGQGLTDSIFFEKYISLIVPGTENLKFHNKQKGEVQHELDGVLVKNERLVLLSSCLDDESINIEDHIYEARIHALRYGGLGGVAVCLLPSIELADDLFDTEACEHIVGVRIFDKRSFYTEGAVDIDAFEHRLHEFLDGVPPFDECDLQQKTDAFPPVEEESQPNDVELPAMLQRSLKSFESLLQALRKPCEFIHEKTLLKLDNCLFQWLGVKGEEYGHEWVLVARIDVPAYEQAIAARYRATLYQYVVTAMKYCKDNFRLLIFHNYDRTLQDEVKTLGDLFRLRVFTINAKEYKAYNNSCKLGTGENGMLNLLESWVTGEIVTNQQMIDEIRRLNGRLNIREGLIMQQVADVLGETRVAKTKAHTVPKKNKPQPAENSKIDYLVQAFRRVDGNISGSVATNVVNSESEAIERVKGT
ncbi:MAG: hypothetical protein LBQ41_03290 [Candidatus Ancillula sp.]|nr:hypothetical protein [Candidatus Ancillula sp.]